MDITVTIYDEEGKEIEPKLCTCGKPGQTCFMGKEAIAWRCNECLYPESSYEAKFVYSEFGSNFPVKFAKKNEDKKYTKEIK